MRFDVDKIKFIFVGVSLCVFIDDLLVYTGTDTQL